MAEHPTQAPARTTLDWLDEVDIEIRLETKWFRTRPRPYVNGQPADEVRVKRDARITWKCKDGRFAILMKDRTPFNPGEHAADGAPGKPATVTVHHAADKVRYSYAILCLTGTKAYCADPDVVVGPPDRDDGS